MCVLRNKNIIGHAVLFVGINIKTEVGYVRQGYHATAV